MPEPQTLRLGMYGVWHVHAAGYAADLATAGNAELVAVWDDNRSRAARFAQDHDARMFDDRDAFLGSGLDAVLVCAPTTHHEAAITAALQSGLPVFTEKALSPDAASSRRIAAMAGASGLAVGVALPWAMSGLCLAIAETVAAGSLGEIVSARFRMANDAIAAEWLPDDFLSPDKSGGGVLIDLAAHPLSMAQVLFGETPGIAGCITGRQEGARVEDTVVAVLSYPSGLVATIEASLAFGAGSVSFEVHGSKGSLLSDGADAVLIRLGPNGDQQEIPVPHRPSPLALWLAAVRDDRTTDDQVRLGCRLSELTDRLVAVASATTRPGPDR